MRCSPLKELVDIFVNVEPTKSEEKVTWTLGETSLCKTSGVKVFDQQITNVDDMTVRRIYVAYLRERQHVQVAYSTVAPAR